MTSESESIPKDVAEPTTSDHTSTSKQLNDDGLDHKTLLFVRYRLKLHQKTYQPTFPNLFQLNTQSL